MQLKSIEAIAETLGKAGVRYLTAGGLAVAAHGYARLTHDVDIVIQLTQKNISLAFKALSEIGYKPLVPITAEQFGSDSMRERFIVEKNMVVLQFFSDDHPRTRIDVFVKEPFSFDAEYETALIGEISPQAVMRFVGLNTLIAMKEAAGRPKDLDDLAHLRMIQEEGNDAV